MTDEQIQKFTQLLEELTENYQYAYILSIVLGLVLLFFIGFEIYIANKRKKAINEYKSTLNEEQLKALAKYKELNK